MGCIRRLKSGMDCNWSDRPDLRFG